MGWGSLLVITFAVLVSAISGVLAYWECICCHNMQTKSDLAFQHAKDSLKSLAICIEDDNGKRGHEQEMTPLTGDIGAIKEASVHVLQLQTPMVDLDLELVLGVGDYAFEQEEESNSETFDIKDEGILSTEDNIDMEILMGIGNDCGVEQNEDDTWLLHGVGDPKMSPTLDKINQVFKLNNS